ncbi:YihY/virulence factor BrkB family protein [Rathayibacter sp. CAU 1779]
MARGNAKSTDASSRRADAGTGARASISAHDAEVDRLKAHAEHDREEFTERLEELADPLRDRLRKPVSTVNGWWKWVSDLKPYRVWNQFSHNDGNLRTAGMSYQSLFAVFAAIWVGFSIAGIWLTGNPNLMHALVGIINEAIPGLISEGDEKGVISQDALAGLGGAFGWTSIIATVGLLWTAIAWLYYTRQAVRAMFDLERDERNYVLQKITDLVLALAFGVVLIVSAAVTVITTDAMEALLDYIGIQSDSFWSTFFGRLIGFAVAIGLNYLVLTVMFRVLSRVVIPWRYLVVGPLLGAAALSGLSVLSGLLIGGASRNPLLATFAVFVGMLLLFNWICRVILLAAAWIAVSMFDHGIDPRKRTPEQLAYEKAVAEYAARLLVAQTAVENAEEHAASVRGLSKWFANRRVRDAHAELERIESEPRPRPPQKHSWWLESSTAVQPPRSPEDAEKKGRGKRADRRSVTDGTGSGSARAGAANGGGPSSAPRPANGGTQASRVGGAD